MKDRQQVIAELKPLAEEALHLTLWMEQAAKKATERRGRQLTPGMLIFAALLLAFLVAHEHRVPLPMLRLMARWILGALKDAPPPSLPTQP